HRRRKMEPGPGDRPLPRWHDPPGHHDEEVHHRPGEALRLQPDDAAVQSAEGDHRGGIAVEHPVSRRLAVRDRPRHGAALATGAVFRCRPDGSKVETYSLGYRNPYRDLAYDDKFNWFHADNDNEDGSKFMGCRMMHVAEGSDFGWRLQYGARCCRPDVARVSV